MISPTLDAFCQKITHGQRLIAIDYGSKKLGVAISDPSLCMALPMNIIIEPNDERKIAHIIRISKEHTAGGIVLGLPINMDGTRSEQTEIVQKFAEKLATKTDLSIFLQDERMTTKAADNLLKTLGLKRKERNTRDDSIAACLILDTVLDYYQKNKSKD